MTTAQQKHFAQVSKVMALAWQFIRENGMNKREALKKAWKNVKARAQMALRVVTFTFTKKDGTMRQAHGTLASSICPVTGESKKCNAVQVYYDTDKKAWRSFLKANLLWYTESREEQEHRRKSEEARRDFLVKIGLLEEEETEEEQWPTMADYAYFM